ncbi:MAG: endonuclease NucS [Nitrososphaerota archaeon]|nr:endonuclease NucS [Candidatus Calditenuaceae archaeon]MDW8072783.1 endonuclease NucS [Nitrososphaerota archaeon]
MVDAEEAIREIRSAIAARKTIAVVGEMEVFYEGRSASWLGSGERLLIIKQDRSVLVHRPFGYEPVNWQPAGSHIDTSIENGKLLIVSTRTSPPEMLKISISRIIHLSTYSLKDEADFQIHAREEDMKQAIIAEPGLVEEGFRIVESERRVRGGFIDILGVDREGSLVVVEIKREKANVKDIEQLIIYSSQIEEEFGSKPRLLIVAPMLTGRAARMARILGVEYRQLSPRKAQEVVKRRKGLDRFF